MERRKQERKKTMLFFIGMSMSTYLGLQGLGLLTLLPAGLAVYRIQQINQEIKESFERDSEY